MKFTINTEVLQAMIVRALKGASQNKLLALTNLMCLNLKDGVLTIITTDGTNYLYVKESNVSGEDFYITVSVDQFCKLISKMTSTTISLELKNNTLEIRGNGVYTMELPLDENGDLITYPDPMASADLNETEVKSITLNDIHTILDSIKPSLALTYETPILTYYFVGPEVIATDAYKAASYGKNLLDTELLVSSQFMDLFSVMTKDTINITVTDKEIIATSEDCIIYGRRAVESIGNYPIDAIEGLISEEFDNICKLNKQDVLNALDRIALFVGTYDNGTIKLFFNPNHLTIVDRTGKSTEDISYIDSKEHDSFECLIDINVLIQQLKAYLSDTIELHYGRDNSIKLVDGNVIQIISLNQE